MKGVLMMLYKIFLQSFQCGDELKMLVKYGAVPLTCSTLKPDQVRHEVLVEIDCTIDVDTYRKQT